jgi:hypothetical protein
MCTQVGLQHEKLDIEDHGLTDKSSSIRQAKTQLLYLCPLMGRELAPFLRSVPFICLLCADSRREELHCVSQHPPSKRLQTLELWIPCEVKVCLEF